MTTVRSGIVGGYKLYGRIVFTNRRLGNLDYVSGTEKDIIRILRENDGFILRSDLHCKLKIREIQHYLNRLYVRGWIELYKLYKPFQGPGKSLCTGIFLCEGVDLPC